MNRLTYIGIAIAVLFIIIANTLTDMVYRWLDPRIRLS